MSASSNLPPQQPGKTEQRLYWLVLAGALLGAVLLGREAMLPSEGADLDELRTILILVSIGGSLLLGIFFGVVARAVSKNTSNTVRRRRMLMGFLAPLSALSILLALGMVSDLLLSVTQNASQTDEPVEYVCQGGRRLSATLGADEAVVTLEGGTTTYSLQSTVVNGHSAYASDDGTTVLSFREDRLFLQENGAITFAECRAQ